MIDGNPRVRYDKKRRKLCRFSVSNEVSVTRKGEIIISKFCEKCGTLLKADDRFCAGCGAPQQSERTVFQSQYTDLDQKTVVQSETESYHYDTNYAGSNYTHEEPMIAYHMGPGGRMKWFKFIIYVQLFLAALSCLGTIGLCASEISDLNTVLDYYSYDSMSSLLRRCIVLDVVYILVNIALAAFAIFVRFRLAKFRLNSPMLYLAFLSVSAGATLIYSILYNVICAQINNWFGYTIIEYFIASTFSSVVVSVVMIVVNHIYFRNRKELFIN